MKAKVSMILAKPHPYIFFTLAVQLDSACQYIQNLLSIAPNAAPSLHDYIFQECLYIAKLLLFYSCILLFQC